MIHPVPFPAPLALIPQQTHIWVNYEDKTYKAPHALKWNGWDWYTVTVAVSIKAAHLIYANKGNIKKQLGNKAALPSHVFKRTKTTFRQIAVN